MIVPPFITWRYLKIEVNNHDSLLVMWHGFESQQSLIVHFVKVRMFTLPFGTSTCKPMYIYQNKRIRWTWDSHFSFRLEKYFGREKQCLPHSLSQYANMSSKHSHVENLFSRVKLFSTKFIDTCLGGDGPVTNLRWIWLCSRPANWFFQQSVLVQLQDLREVLALHPFLATEVLFSIFVWT